VSPENHQRSKPLKVEVHVTSGAGMDIAWSDGHASHYPFDYLREQCPCANCKQERQQHAEGQPAAAGAASGGVLPMFKPRPKARHAEAVGHYAIQLEFNDGHRAGIYSYEYLRSICPCEQCRALEGFR
jgi:DUF971 family protein